MCVPVVLVSAYIENHFVVSVKNNQLVVGVVFEVVNGKKVVHSVIVGSYHIGYAYLDCGRGFDWFGCCFCDFGSLSGLFDFWFFFALFCFGLSGFTLRSCEGLCGSRSLDNRFGDCSLSRFVRGLCNENVGSKRGCFAALLLGKGSKIVAKGGRLFLHEYGGRFGRGLSKLLRRLVV